MLTDTQCLREEAGGLDQGKAGEAVHRERPGNSGERWFLGVGGVQSKQKAIRQSCRSSEKGSRVQVQGPPRTYLVERLTQGWGGG